MSAPKNERPVGQAPTAFIERLFGSQVTTCGWCRESAPRVCIQCGDCEACMRSGAATNTPCGWAADASGSCACCRAIARQKRRAAHFALCQIAAAVALALLAELASEASAQVDPYFREKWRLDERCHELGVPR